MVFALTVGQHAWAQEGSGRTSSTRGENPNAGQNQGTTTGTETIKGVVAGITKEGEFTYDYRANRGVAAEAAFLTVVGSPVKSEMGETSRRTNANANANTNENERSEASGKKRHNVYIVWLSPRTKICEQNTNYGTANRTRTQTQNQAEKDKKEVSFDQLEVGDHVEIQCDRREESAANSVAHQTEQMRQKHGRHRVYIVNAKSITICPMKADEQTGTKSEGTANERPR
jgi:hypothetical protein